jgi:hypothetical protein
MTVSLWMMHSTTERPIYGIDVHYYKTNLTVKYLSKFLDDLTLQDSMQGNLIHLKNGNYSRSFKSLDAL